MTDSGRKRPRVWFTTGECNRIIDAFGRAPTAVRNRAVIVVLWRAGLRLQEALDLTLSDLDAKKRTLRVRHGKGDASRVAAMDSGAWALLETWLELRKALGVGNKGANLVFVTLKGYALRQNYVRAMCQRMGKRAGIDKRVHPHGFRHSFAEGLAQEKQPLRVIQQALGHERASTTDIYLRDICPSELIDAIDARPDWRGED